MSDTDIVLRFLAAYRTGDVAAATELMAPDFRFTSPQDEHIDTAAYLGRCFPTADRFAAQRVLQVASVAPGTVFLHYEYDLVDGGRYRNAEVLTIRDGLIAEVEVYFGGSF